MIMRMKMKMDLGHKPCDINENLVAPNESPNRSVGMLRTIVLYPLFIYQGHLVVGWTGKDFDLQYLSLDRIWI